MFYNAQSEINQVPNSELQINNFFTQDSQLNLPLKNVKHHRHAGQQKRKKKKREKIRAIKINNSHTFPKKKVLKEESTLTLMHFNIVSESLNPRDVCFLGGYKTPFVEYGSLLEYFCYQQLKLKSHVNTLCSFSNVLYVPRENYNTSKIFCK